MAAFFRAAFGKSRLRHGEHEAGDDAERRQERRRRVKAEADDGDQQHGAKRSDDEAAEAVDGGARELQRH